MTKVAPYSPITNVFVLMLENNSFDRLLGFSGVPGLNGLNGNESNTYNGNTYITDNPIVDPLTTDPGHEFQNTLVQLCGPNNPYAPNAYPAIDNSGFVYDYALNSGDEGTGLPDSSHFGDVMSDAGASGHVQTLTWLALNYAVCDNWFSSMPGPTWPNRFFAMGGSSGGLDDSPTKTEMAKWLGNPFGGFTYEHGSIFDLLSANGMKWRLYNDGDNRFAQNPTHVPGGGIAIVRALKNIHVTDVNDISDLPGDLAQNYPYQFTWIEPNYGNIVNNSYSGGSSQHPMDSLAAGDAMVAYVYNAIRNSSLWQTSMLIITYDEHGGFYDHVAPPAATPPGDTQTPGLNTQGFTFDQYGVRVPAVVVSPLIPAQVDSMLYDHTTILKTVMDLFGLPDTSLTNRVQNANSLVHLLSNLRTNIEAAPEPAPQAEAVRAPVAANAVDDNEPLPEKGNVIGFLHAAAKADAELAGGGEAATQAALAKVEAIQTKGEATAYLNEVEAKVAAAKAAADASGDQTPS
jgi:phospholipase C